MSNIAATSASFADFLDSAIADSGASLPNGAQPGAPAGAVPFTPPPAPAAAATPPAATAPAAAAPAAGVVVPDALTQQFVNPGAPAPVAPGAPDAEAKAQADRDAELDKLFSTKQGDAFKAIKGDLSQTREALNKTRAEYEQKLAALKAEVETAKTSSVNPAEVEQYKTQLAEMQKINEAAEKELMLTKVEATREYKAAVTARHEEISTAANEIATRNAAVSKSELLSAIQETDPAKQEEKIAAIASSLNERDRLRLYSLQEAHAKVLQQAEFVKANAKSALEMVEQRRKSELARVEQTEAQEYSRALDESWNEITQVFPFLRPVEGNDAWNNTVKTVNEQARQLDVQKLSAKERAQLTFQGFSLPLVAEVTKFYASKVVSLEAELKALRGTSPGAGSGNRQSAAPGTEVTPGLGFMDAIEQGAGRL